MSKPLQFNAKFDGFNLSTKNKITLILPENTKDDILGKLVKMKGSDLIVQFGDPQTSMDFEDDEQHNHHQGIMGRIDQHGLVQSIENKHDLFSAQNVSNSVENSTKQAENVLEDPYASKVVVWIQAETGDDEVKFIFPIVNARAALPNKYINGELVGVATFDEVMSDLGMVGIEEDGVIFYGIEDLVVFGAQLREADSVFLAGDKVAYPDYYGMEVVIIKEEESESFEYVFTIIGNHAAHPKKIAAGYIMSGLSVREIKLEIGIDPIEGLSEGYIRYSIKELLNDFDGELRIVEETATAELDHVDYDRTDEIDYGSHIVITRNEVEDSCEYIFPILDGLATLPMKYRNKIFEENLNIYAVKRVFGIDPLFELSDTATFSPNVLLELGGIILHREVDSELEADLDQSEQDIQSDSELEREISFAEDNQQEPIETKHQEQQVIAEPTKEQIEEFILDKKPKFDDIPYDFPTLLEIKKSGKSWMDISKEINVPSTQISTALTKYKKKVKDLMTGGAA